MDSIFSIICFNFSSFIIFLFVFYKNVKDIDINYSSYWIITTIGQIAVTIYAISVYKQDIISIVVLSFSSFITGCWLGFLISKQLTMNLVEKRG